MRTVLVLGGYGFFGQRISAVLASTGSVRVLVGGRDLERASAATRAMGLPVEHAVALDAHDSHLADVLRRLRVDVLIHTAGPFQGQDYSVARAAIEARCHYIDLADGRQFVVGMSSLSTFASAAGVTVMSGASSVPALSSAVIDRYSPRFRRPLLGVPLVVRRIPAEVPLRHRPPPSLTSESMPAEACIPILKGMSGAATLVTQQATLFPQRYPTVRTVSFQAGFASDLGHFMVWGLAGLVKAGVLTDMNTFASPLSRLSRWMEPIVSDKGGMFVTLEGEGADGAPLRIDWNLVAEKNHGPHIPCGAAIALARKIGSGASLPRGAMPCMGLLTVDEFLEPLRDLNISERVA